MRLEHLTAHRVRDLISGLLIVEMPRLREIHHAGLRQHLLPALQQVGQEEALLQAIAEQGGGAS